jgi:hypothetical protein
MAALQFFFFERELNRLRLSSELRCSSRRFAARCEADDQRDHRDSDVESGVGGVIAD